MLGWLLGQHRFTVYKSKHDDLRGPRILLTREAADIERTIRLAEATSYVRDLVDTPAADLGPAELEAAARELAEVRCRSTLWRDARTGFSNDCSGRPGRFPRAHATPDRA
jgi:leucyl aminopeptidase